jgi:hypothetical protein
MLFNRNRTPGSSLSVNEDARKERHVIGFNGDAKLSSNEFRKQLDKFLQLSYQEIASKLKTFSQTATFNAGLFRVLDHCVSIEGHRGGDGARD